MPTPYIQKLAKEHNVPVSEVEKKWDAAKKAAAKEGKGKDYAYITGILKKMMGEKSVVHTAAVQRLKAVAAIPSNWNNLDDIIADGGRACDVAQWVKDKLAALLARQGLEFDKRGCNGYPLAIGYCKAGDSDDAALALSEIIKATHLNIHDGVVGPMTPFCKMTDYVKSGGARFHIVVKYIASTNKVYVSIQE